VDGSHVEIELVVVFENIRYIDIDRYEYRYSIVIDFFTSPSPIDT
jgi:hypothetical protein